MTDRAGIFALASQEGCPEVASGRAARAANQTEAATGGARPRRVQERAPWAD